MKKYCSLTILFLLLFLNSAFAGITGKIMGRIIDANNNEPLIGVNVIIQGTAFGAATDINGYYIILNVPPGKYTLKAIMIGYTSVTVQDVVVKMDKTLADTLRFHFNNDDTLGENLKSLRGKFDKSLMDKVWKYHKVGIIQSLKY